MHHPPWRAGLEDSPGDSGLEIMSQQDGETGPLCCSHKCHLGELSSPAWQCCGWERRGQPCVSRAPGLPCPPSLPACCPAAAPASCSAVL